MNASQSSPASSIEQIAKDAITFFLARLKERSQNRDKEATVPVLQAQLKALRRWGSKEPADLSKIHQPSNEWRKAAIETESGTSSERSEAYRAFFQPLLDELREKHRFTGARVAQPQNWYSFASGISGIQYSFSFAGRGDPRRSGDGVRGRLGDFLADAEALLAVRLERVSLDDIARQAQPTPLHPQHGAHHHE
jgi:hypothetical protein